MRRLHLIVGLAGVVAFLLTGQYMDRWLGHLEGMAALPRMLYRSGHIYLLLAALINVALGAYLETGTGWRRAVRGVASALVLMAPALLLIGFMQEPARADFERPYARPAIYGCFLGVLLHAIVGLVPRHRRA